MIFALLAALGLGAVPADSVVISDTVTVIPPGDAGFELEVVVPPDTSSQATALPAAPPSPPAPPAPPEPNWIIRQPTPPTVSVTPTVQLPHPSPPVPPSERK